MDAQQQQQQQQVVMKRTQKMESTDVASNYTAVSNPRSASVSRTQAGFSSGGSSSHVSRAHRSRRASLEADIPDIKNVVEARGRSKKEMQELNERLGSYIEKTRYLQAQNKKLKDELSGLKARWGKETEKIRQMYDVELKQLRRLLDDAERMKGEKDAKLASLDSYNKDMRDQLNDSNNQNEHCNEKIDRLNHELADRDGEIALLRRRLAHLEDEKGRVKQQLIKMKDDIARLHTDLDAETAARIGAQTENQTLREELEFLKRVHDQELKELYVLIKRDEDDSREFWKTELGQAIHEIQKEYDDKVDTVRVELEAIYMNKFRDLAKNQNHGTSESAYFKEENKKIKDTMAELRKKIADLQARNDTLERMLEDIQRESESERRRHAEEQERLEKELTGTEADLRRVLNELQALLDAKISLELEIAAYKKLLDAEGIALEKIDSISRQSSFRNTEKPTVSMEQRVERRSEQQEIRGSGYSQQQQIVGSKNVVYGTTTSSSYEMRGGGGGGGGGIGSISGSSTEIRRAVPPSSSPYRHQQQQQVYSTPSGTNI
ncbi:hypothetical protein BOX15_Mlig019539g1 [Macrostomum lignano]|nr:hypothetical protein BOX15_Mlig019539g1 [Macrostomum lignano]